MRVKSCLCGCSLSKGTLIISIVGLIVGLILGVLAITFSDVYNINMWSLTIAGILIVANGLLLYGAK
jgi:predicted Co/Zn/Cd cation transporter (cation efflux family)